MYWDKQAAKEVADTISFLPELEQNLRRKNLVPLFHMTTIETFTLPARASAFSPLCMHLHQIPAIERLLLAPAGQD